MSESEIRKFIDAFCEQHKCEIYWRCRADLMLNDEPGPHGLFIKALAEFFTKARNLATVSM